MARSPIPDPAWQWRSRTSPVRVLRGAVLPPSEPTWTRARAWALLPMFLLLVSRGAAWAAGPGAAVSGSPRAASAPVTADSLFQEGRALMAAGRAAEACPRFSESNRLDPATGTLLNLAVCNETIGKTATAWSQFRLAEVASQADHREDRVTLAREHLAALLPKLSVITVQVSDAQRVPGLRLTVDGLAWGEPLWNVPTPIDPGVHTVVAEAPSRGTRAFPVSVGTRAQKLLVVIDLPAVVPLPAALGLSRSREPERGAPAASPPPQPPVAPSGLVARPVSGAVPAPGAGREEAAAPQPRSLSFVLACVAAGIGASALIVGSVYGLQAFSRWDSRNTLCPMNQCTDAAGIQAQIGAENAARDADVSVVLGLAALSASGYFFYRWHEERTEELTAEPRSWSLAPSVSMRQAGLRLEHGW